MRALLLLLVTLAGAACYETPRPDCAFQCGADGECPEGYSCNQDGWCVLDTAPEAVECGPDLTDDDDADAGEDVDAGQPDAEP